MNDRFDYSEDERAVLRQARDFRDLVETKGWKTYVEILRRQAEYREGLIQRPLIEMAPDSIVGVDAQGQLVAGKQTVDFQTRVCAQETIKGAVIGLNIALSIPNATIQHADEIVRDHSSPQEDSNG